MPIIKKKEIRRAKALEKKGNKEGESP